MVAGAGAGWAMVRTAPGKRGASDLAVHIRLALLIASALLSVLISLFSPSNAMWAYLFNLAAPPLAAWRARRSGAAAGASAPAR